MCTTIYIKISKLVSSNVTGHVANLHHQMGSRDSLRWSTHLNNGARQHRPHLVQPCTLLVRIHQLQHEFRIGRTIGTSPQFKQSAARLPSAFRRRSIHDSCYEYHFIHEIRMKPTNYFYDSYGRIIWESHLCIHWRRFELTTEHDDDIKTGSTHHHDYCFRSAVCCLSIYLQAVITI